MKQKRKQLLMIVGFVALGVVVGVVGLLAAVLPQRSHTAKLDTQIASLQTKLISLHVRPKHSQAIKAADLFELARAMPADTDMPGILLDLSRAARNSSVDLTSIVPGTPVVQTDGSSVSPIQVSVTGNWDGVTKFLRTLRLEVRTSAKKLSVDGRMFVVDSVSLVSSAAKNGDVTAQLNVNAYSYGVVVPTVPTTTDSTTTTTSSGSAQASGASG
jgi:Tfp pilus assembly protein PilO